VHSTQHFLGVCVFVQPVCAPSSDHAVAGAVFSSAAVSMACVAAAAVLFPRVLGLCPLTLSALQDNDLPFQPPACTCLYLMPMQVQRAHVSAML
jgi:hypothetical protein